MILPPITSILHVHLLDSCEIWSRRESVSRGCYRENLFRNKNKDTMGHSPKLILNLLHFSLLLLGNLQVAFPDKRPLRVQVFIKHGEHGEHVEHGEYRR